MPWQPLPRIAFAVATYPFAPSSPADLPLEIGDELYVIEETPNGEWLRGYLVAPPSLLSGLTSVKGQTLEARVFSGIFPRSCVEIRELLGDVEREHEDHIADIENHGITNHKLTNGNGEGHGAEKNTANGIVGTRQPLQELPNAQRNLSVPVKRDPNAPRPAAPVPMLKIGDETPTSASEPLIDEISSCLREWHSKNLHELLLSRKYAQLDELSQLITGLNLSRQQFLYNVLTANEYDRLREKTVWDLVRVNKLCGGEVIVRDPTARGRVLTGDDSIVEVTKLQSVMSLLDEPPQPSTEATSLHQLSLEVKGFAGASTEDTSLVIYLVSKPPHAGFSNLSECFTLDIPPGGTIGNLSQSVQTKTLFTDLSSQDIGEAPSADSELYLVVKVLASQQVAVGKPPSRSGTNLSMQNGYSREPPKPTSSGGVKPSRRSLMWGGSKSTRSAFSRTGQAARMESLAEQETGRPSTNGSVSRDGPVPPGSAGSKSGVAPGEPAQTVQRTVGIGVLKLNAIVKGAEEVEQVVHIWNASPRSLSERGPEDDWDPLVRDLLDSPTANFEKSRRGERLQLLLKGFNHPDADALIKATPTMLSGVTKTSRLGFSGAPTRPRSDIYFTLNTAALARQNLLSRYGGSATSMPTTLIGQHLQVTLEVRRSTGERIENCIHVSSNTEPVTTFKSAAAERGEVWRQTIRLALSPKDVPNAHVVMFLSDMPNPPFAVAHMPLWDNQAFIRDGAHGLLLYKIDEFTSTALPGPVGKGGYLSLPFAQRRDEHSADVTGPLAVLLVDTYLSSTRFSQDRVILGLLKWKELPKEDVPQMLRELIFVPEIEVVKLLSDVLDGLFGILVEYSGNDDYEDLVFTALVRVLDIVHDRRFNLIPLVDQYAEQKFNYPFATSALVRSFTRLLENPTDSQTARKLRATFKVVRHILKFITHARGQQKAKEAGIGITSSAQGFTRHLRSIFKALDEMMRNTSPVLVGSQTLAVQHFHTWLPELAGLLSTEEILHIAIDFMDSCTQVKGKLVLYKLILIINYSKLDLFAQKEQKSALSANTVRWITPHWGYSPEVTDQWRDQIRLCCSVLASQIEHLGPEIPDHVPRIIDSYLAIQSSPRKERNRLSLLFPTSYPFPTKNVTEEFAFDEALVELSSILSALSTSNSGMQLEVADDELTPLLENLLQVEMSILMGEAFPSHWLSVHIHHHKSIMKTLQYVASILLESCLPEPDEAEDFNTELWKAFFTTLLKLVGSTSLALETFPEQKRRAVWKIAGDVREHGADLLRRTWEAIGWEASAEEQSRYGLTKMGGYQVSYVPTLVGPIVELCLSVHEGLRMMAVEVLQTMIVSEWTMSEDLSAIQTEMIDCLDEFFKTKPLNDTMLQKPFITELLTRFEPLADIPDEPLYAALRELIGTLDEFLDLLAAVHSGDNTHEASHIINRLRLMEFLRDMQKEEIFVRYVHQLAELQAETRNYAGAGLALRLHSDLYEWDPTRQCTPLLDPVFPAQSAFERKEKIYFDMIKHFEEGESWSNALTAYKELQTQYETNTFDFAKLARTERAIATIYETISKSDKLVSKYFKVVYKGLGFPASVRDKEFIYEGSPTEKASAFTDRMQEQYPAANIVTGGDVDEVEGQYLVVSAVTPHRDLNHHVFQRARVPHVIRDFLLSSHPQVFSISTKRHTSGPVHEHFAEKLVYTTEDPFPTIMRRSEIVEITEVRLSAHETALERIVRKTQEITALEKRVAEGEDEHANLLLEAVNASVSPTSETSVVCYRQLLPTTGPRSDKGSDAEDEDDDDDEEPEEPELEPQESAIKMALLDHAIVLKRCLATFAKSSNEVLKKRHEDLRQGFEIRFAPELATFAPPAPVVLREAVSTPTPPWRKSPTTSEPSPPTANIAAALNASVGEQEASVLQPVSLRQRGPTLSILGGRRKNSDPVRPTGSPQGTIAEPPKHRRNNSSKDSNAFKPNNRRSILRNPLGESPPQVDNSVTDWGANFGLRKSTDRVAVEERPTAGEQDQIPQQPVLAKKNSVRKRLSMLRIGGGAKKGGTMGSLDEE